MAEKCKFPSVTLDKLKIITNSLKEIYKKLIVTEGVNEVKENYNYKSVLILIVKGPSVIDRFKCFFNFY